jgi:hypothetical protein
MGHPVNSRFRTIILQAENGIARLKSEFSDIDTGDVDLDEYLRITPPPKAGLAFRSLEFRDRLRAAIEDFGAGVLVIDPWNRVVEDEKHKDFRFAIDAINDALPTNSADKPAVVIVTHLGKQVAGKRNRQASKLPLPLSLNARCFFLLEHATSRRGDDRVVLTCVKNCHGALGEPTAWHRQNGLYQPCEGFDWQAYNNP